MTAEAEVPVPHMPLITRYVARLIMHLISDFSMVGRENFPKPPYVCISNHMTYFDALVACSMIVESMPALTAKKYHKGLVGKFLDIFIAPIWIEQESPDRAALKTALALLKQGSPLALAPEGTRSKTFKLKEGLGGAAFLIRKADVPIVPIAVIGTDKIFKSLRPKVRGMVGKPFRLPPIAARADKDQLKADTDRLMCAIAALLPEEYHGVYAGHPLIEEMRSIVYP